MRLLARWFILALDHGFLLWFSNIHVPTVCSIPRKSSVRLLKRKTLLEIEYTIGMSPSNSIDNAFESFYWQIHQVAKERKIATRFLNVGKTLKEILNHWL